MRFISSGGIFDLNSSILFTEQSSDILLGVYVHVSVSGTFI